MDNNEPPNKDDSTDNGEQSVDEVMIGFIPGSEDGKVSKNEEPEEYEEFLPKVPDDFDLVGF